MNPPSVNKWLVAVAVMLPTIMEIVDTTVVNVSLAHIQGSMNAGLDEVTWVLTSYLVSNAIIIPLSGWLSNTFGRKKYLSFSLGLFTVSSFFCGAANNLTTLIIFRILQGIGGGAMQPLSQAILLESFPPAQHGIAMAVFGIGAMMGPIMGPYLGGWITDNWSWRWVFYINLPIGGLALLLTYFFIFDPSYIKRAKVRIDYWGIAFLSLGLGCLQVVLDKGEMENWFSSNFIITMSVFAAGGLILFVVTEIFSENPVVNLKVFKNPAFSAGNLIMFMAFFCLFGSLVLLPIFVQSLLGYTSFLAGEVLAPGGFSSLIAMFMVGRLIARYDARWFLALGIIINVYALYLMSQFTLDIGFWGVTWPRLVQGFGLGCLFIPLTTMTLSSIPKPEMGNATAIYNLLRNLGGSFGIAFMTTMTARRTQFHQSRLVEHLTPFDLRYHEALKGIKNFLPRGGLPPAAADGGALGVLYRETLRHASMLAVVDVFWLLAIGMFCLLPLLFLFRRSKVPH